MTQSKNKMDVRRREGIVPALLLAVVSAFFFFTDWDIKLLSFFFDQDAGRFLLNKTFGPRISYYVVPAIGMVMALGGLLVALGGIWYERWRPFRKEATFLFVLVLLGPGLLVNGIFKEYYGRPRPNQCEVFSGDHPFQPVLKYSSHKTGDKCRSFPCGHASIGFSVMAPYFFLRGRNRRWAILFMLLGLGLGAWAGVARMVEGRHFASDVIWAGAMVYFCGLALARPFKFETRNLRS